MSVVIVEITIHLPKQPHLHPVPNPIKGPILLEISIHAVHDSSLTKESFSVLLTPNTSLTIYDTSSFAVSVSAPSSVYLVKPCLYALLTLANTLSRIRYQCALHSISNRYYLSLILILCVCVSLSISILILCVCVYFMLFSRHIVICLFFYNSTDSKFRKKCVYV